jgi:hypothetical protein
MKRTDPRGRWWRPGLIAGLSLLAAFLAVRWASGPRYQGRGVNHWFSRWDVAGEVDGREDPRLTELAAAGPEVVPLLVSALAVEDRLPGRLYNALREDLPRRVQIRMPRWRVADEVRSDAYGVLRKQFNRPDHLRAFTGLVGRLPTWALEASCETLSIHTGVVEVAEPHLRRLVRSAEPAVAVSAGVSWLWLADPPAARRDEVLAGLARQPDALFADRNSVPGPLIASRLIHLGSGSASAEPWMVRWLQQSNHARLQVCGAMVLAAIAPDRYPLARTLPDLVPRMGSAGLRTLLSLSVPRHGGRHPQARVVAEVMGPWLESARAAELAAAWNRLPAEDGGRTEAEAARSIQLVAMRGLLPLGLEAMPLREHLLPLLRSADATVAWQAALGLARLGPVEPATIPDVLPGLTNGFAAPPLLLLLSAYGSDAASALPLLDALDASDAPDDGGTTAEASAPGPLDPASEGGLHYGIARPPDQVSHGLAVMTGLTNVWPSISSVPGEQAAPRPGTDGKPSAVTLTDLVRETRRRLAGAR